MSKAEKLQNYLKSADEPKKWKAYVIVAVGVLVGVGLFFGGMAVLNPIIDKYLDENKEITALYNFYDTKAGETTDAVYFVGASNVAESVYPPEINRILAEKGFENITVYTAYVSSECPLDRLIHLQKLIDSKPKLVIYGIVASKISKDSVTDDNILIVKDRLSLYDNISQFYTDDELQLLYGETNPYDKKRFIKSALLYALNPHREFNIDYSVDPLGGAYAREHIFGANVDPKNIAYLYDPETVLTYPISNSSRTVKAFNFILSELEKNGIKVVVVNAPINPLTSDKISEDTRNKYFSILDDTGYEWADFEYRIPAEYFFDGSHTTFAGAMKLAPMWADLIIQELT